METLIAILVTAASGRVKSGDVRVSNWLDGRVRLNRFNNNILSKFPDNGAVDFVSRSTFPAEIRSTWHVKMKDGENFRVKNGTPLHRRLEKKHQELLEKRESQPQIASYHDFIN